MYAVYTQENSVLMHAEWINMAAQKAKVINQHVTGGHAPGEGTCFIPWRFIYENKLYFHI